MDLDFLGKTSKVTPLLVRLYDSQNLSTLAKDKKPMARVELMTAVTELLEMELAPKEMELIADVLMALVRQAEMDLRQALAERLSAMENVPLRLVLQLANDEISVARPILNQSPVLTDLDLIYLIKSKGAAHWQAIAGRETLSNQVMNLLADTGELGTAKVLAENKTLRLTAHALAALIDMAQNSIEITRPLLRRPEVSAEMIKCLYLVAGQALKDFIVENYDMEHCSLTEAVDDIVIEMVDAADGKADFAPTSSMIKAAERFQSKGLLSVKLMMGTLRRGQVQSFVAQFSKYTGLSVQSTEEILKQSSGQGLAVACKACDIEKPDFISIFLLTNSMRNGTQLVDLKDMTKAINYYTRIGADVAKNIIDNSREDILSE